MKKSLGVLGTIALAISLILSSCSSSSEETTSGTGILERLNAASGFEWMIIPLDSYNRTEAEMNAWKSSGLIEEIWPSDQGECLYGVFVFEDIELAKKAMESSDELNTDTWESADAKARLIEDPVSKYGIVLLDYGQPCSKTASLAFEEASPSLGNESIRANNCALIADWVKAADGPVVDYGNRNMFEIYAFKHKYIWSKLQTGDKSFDALVELRKLDYDQNYYTAPPLDETISLDNHSAYRNDGPLFNTDESWKIINNVRVSCPNYPKEYLAQNFAPVLN